MLPTTNYVDRPKTKSAIALTKIILKICTFSIKTHDFTRKKQKINLNFELALNKMNCELMLTYDTPALRQTGSRNLTGQKNASHDMGYLYEACDQISDFCHQ
jgi:hypothetical protein